MRAIPTMCHPYDLVQQLVQDNIHDGFDFDFQIGHFPPKNSIDQYMKKKKCYKTASNKKKMGDFEGNKF